MDRLVPGITTVTTNAQYYALHGLVAWHAQRRRLAIDATLSLLRRVEVVMGAVSTRHRQVDPLAHLALPEPHGYAKIAPTLGAAGGVDIEELAAGRYAKSDEGFWGAYRGSEGSLRITAGSELVPGEQFDHVMVESGLGDVFSLADRAALDMSVLDENAHLCTCRSASSTLGELFVKGLPAGQLVGAFGETLPGTTKPDGRPAQAELSERFQDWSWPQWCLGVLFLGARRARELDGDELHGFQGHDPELVNEELSPLWLAKRIDEWYDRPVRDFARWLTEIMPNRSQRTALRKAGRDARTGLLKIPSQVHLRDDYVSRTGREGEGQLSLRLD